MGTRNIPDYMQNMSESISENIPALLYALNEAQNYASNSPERVNNFHLIEFNSHSCKLVWEYPENSQIYFEIYRNQNNKMACNDSSLVGISSKREFEMRTLRVEPVYF